MHRELAGDVPRRRRVRRQVLEHRVDVRDVGRTAAIAAPEHGLRPRLGPVRPEGRGARVEVRPEAGQQLGELPHVVLPVVGPDPERVQFQHLARQVLVQPAPAPLARGRVRPDGPILVQIDEHHRMGDRGPEQVGEARADVRTDRLALEARRRQPALRAPAHDGEVVGPEPDQPLVEAVRRQHALGDPPLDVGLVERLKPRRGALPALGPLPAALDPLVGPRPRGEARRLARAARRAGADAGQHRLGLAGRGLAGPEAIAEADGGDRLTRQAQRRPSSRRHPVEHTGCRGHATRRGARNSPRGPHPSEKPSG